MRLVPFASMPSPLPRQVRWSLSARTAPPSSAFPGFKAGRPLHQPFRGLLSVYSRYGLLTRWVARRPFYTEGSSSFITSTAASVATGRSEPVPGRDFHPLWTSAFHGALEPVAYLSDSYCAVSDADHSGANLCGHSSASLNSSRSCHTHARSACKRLPPGTSASHRRRIFTCVIPAQHPNWRRPLITDAA